MFACFDTMIPYKNIVLILYNVVAVRRIGHITMRTRTKPLTSIKRSINQSMACLIKEPAFYLKSLHSLPPTRMFKFYNTLGFNKQISTLSIVDKIFFHLHHYDN